MKRLMLNYKTLVLEEYEVTTATLVKLWNCECGLPFLREGLQLGKKYRIVLGVEYQVSGECNGCHRPFLVTYCVVEDGHTGIYMGFPRACLEIDAAQPVGL